MMRDLSPIIRHQPISLTDDKVLRTAVVNSEHHGFADIVWDGAEKKFESHTQSIRPSC